MSAVVDFVQDVGDVIGDAVEAVGDVVEDVGDFVMDKIVEPVAEVVESTVQSALENPIATIASVAAIATGNPQLLPYINAANTVANGGDLGDVLKSAAVSYVAGQVGGDVLKQTGSRIASGVAAGATGSALSGGDIVQGALSGGISAGISNAAQAISDADFENWSQKQAEQLYLNSVAPTDLDVLAADPTIPIYPLSNPTTATGQGYYDEITGDYVPDVLGGLTAPLTEASGTGTIDAPVSNMSGLNPQPTEFTTPVDNTPLEGYNPIDKDLTKTGLKAIVNGLMDKSGDDYSGLAPLTMGGLGSTELGFSEPEFLDTAARYLGPKSSTQTTPVTQTAQPQELKQLYSSLTPELSSVMAERVGAPQQFVTPDPSVTNTRLMASGGLADSSLNTQSSGSWMDPKITKVYQPNMLPAAPLMTNTMKLNPLRQLHESLVSRQRTAGGLAHGGLPQKYAEATPAGHKPEFITGLTGYYASGKGTGQSDDIDAMLHDGDYVADADLVAALGDGSSKAGAEALEKFRRQIPHQQHAAGGAAVPAKIADGEYVFPASFVTAIGGGDNKAGAKILDKMREAIRAHKRSAPTTKIPPKAKSPLEYLKMVKG